MFNPRQSVSQEAQEGSRDDLVQHLLEGIAGSEATRASAYSSAKVTT